MDNKFFNATPLYKEYLILETINNNESITQREISKLVNISLSMVNQYLTEYENSGYLVKKYISTKNIKYFLTSKGIERMKVLNIGYLNATQNVYKRAKKEVKFFLKSIIDKGFKKLIFYGAGEVAEIMLQTINEDQEIPIEVVGIIDDLIYKQGKKLVNTVISDINILNNIEHDGVLISSYTNHDEIYNELVSKNYDKEKILYFFNRQ